MKDIKDIAVVINQGSTKVVNKEEGMTPPEAVVNLVNVIVSRFDGIYQFTGNKNSDKLVVHKQELTKALFKVRDQFNEQDIENAIDFFAINGGKFPPSVPEFIQAVLGNHVDMISHPEHKWFDPSRALTQYTPEQIQTMGKNGIAKIRDMMKNKIKHEVK